MSNHGINSFLFSTPEMTRVFSPGEQLRAMTRFEWALSRALESNERAEVGSGAVLEQLLSMRILWQLTLLNAKRGTRVMLRSPSSSTLPRL